jgi:hypothetical protein
MIVEPEHSRIEVEEGVQIDEARRDKRLPSIDRLVDGAGIVAPD